MNGDASWEWLRRSLSCSCLRKGKEKTNPRGGRHLGMKWHTSYNVGTATSRTMLLLWDATNTLWSCLSEFVKWDYSVTSSYSIHSSSSFKYPTHPILHSLFILFSLYLHSHWNLHMSLSLIHLCKYPKVTNKQKRSKLWYGGESYDLWAEFI